MYFIQFNLKKINHENVTIQLNYRVSQIKLTRTKGRRKKRRQPNRRGVRRRRRRMMISLQAAKKIARRPATRRMIKKLRLSEFILKTILLIS